MNGRYAELGQLPLDRVSSLEKITAYVTQGPEFLKEVKPVFLGNERVLAFLTWWHCVELFIVDEPFQIPLWNPHARRKVSKCQENLFG